MVRPLSLKNIQDKALRRAGLDYWYLLDVLIYDDLEGFYGEECWGIYADAVDKSAEGLYGSQVFHDHDFFVFGPESRGLPEPF